MPARRGLAAGHALPAKPGARRSALQARSHGAAGAPRVQVAEMQRARLLAAAIAAIAELGYSRASVAHITARARVSRRTFYDLFANREDCLLAVLEDAVQRISAEIAETVPAGSEWRERVRGGLLAILSFFDREPVLARVCVVQALQGGPRVLARREEILAGLATVLDEGRESSSRGRDCTVLAAEGLVGAGFAIVYARLVGGAARVAAEPDGRVDELDRPALSGPRGGALRAASSVAGAPADGARRPQRRCRCGQRA
jgi:AcrR family transcriptional regulator